MRIIFVDDDLLETSYFTQKVRDRFENSEVICCANAAEFVKAIPSLSADPPDAVILDMMLPWCDYDGLSLGGMPEEYRLLGGGIWCAKLTLATPQLAKVPIIIHSVVTERSVGEELPSTVFFVSKAEHPDSLIRVLRSIMLATKNAVTTMAKDIFVVHGQDHEAKEAVTRFVEQLGGRAVLLHEKPNSGRTVIEKFEDHANVAFAIVLLTPDDVGGTDAKALQQRARQNVIFELGFFFAKLGRNKVCALHKEGVEIPSEIHGVIYTSMDEAGTWRMAVARELKAAGIPLDHHKVI